MLFALPTLLFLVVSFFDYDRVGIYPAFLLDNYRDLLTSPATVRVYLSSLRFAAIVWAITLFIGFIMAGFTRRKQALHDLMAHTLVIRK